MSELELKSKIFKDVSNFCVSGGLHNFKMSELMANEFNLCTEVKLRTACDSLVVDQKLSIPKFGRIIACSINYQEARLVTEELEEIKEGKNNLKR